ncbi:hypothetical protein G7Y79_00024g054870 [Physcia stellaris]|nr:hypothetical protein G7Y79_00024g054870 [Physcia stellaris]
MTLQMTYHRILRSAIRNLHRVLRNRRALGKYPDPKPKLKSRSLKPFSRHQSSECMRQKCSEDDALCDISVPAENPFLVAAAYLKKNSYLKRDRGDGSDLALKVLVQPRQTKIYTAREAKTYDNTVRLPLDIKNARLISKNLYARTHYLDSSTLVQCIVPARLNEKCGENTSLLDTLTSDCDQYQTRIMKFYLAGVRLAVKMMGGLEMWTAASVASREQTFARIFDAYPLDIAAASLGPIAHAVPLQDIFSNDTAIHLKWQRFHKLVFVMTCDATFRHRIAPGRDCRKNAYGEWQGMIAGPMFEELELGELEDMPVKWGTGVVRNRTSIYRTIGSLPMDDIPVDILDD